MQVKRFVAPNMSEALKKVREAVGADAVILSNKRVKGGIELVTVVDQPESDASDVYPLGMQPARGRERQTMAKTEVSKLEQEVDRMQSQARKRAADLAATLGHSERQQFAKAMSKEVEPDVATSALREEQNSSQLEDEKMKAAVKLAVAEIEKTHSAKAEVEANTPNESQQMSQMREELQSMRSLIEQQLSSMAWGQFASAEPEKASLWRRLKRMGIQSNVADSLLKKVSNAHDHKHVWMALMQQLSNDLPVVGHDIVSGGGIFSFVGPTGAGKTTSIGKLAARYVMEHGAENLALVTTDTYRIAAHEQLRTIGRILNVPVKVVDKKNPLDRVLYALRHKQLVLIDTAGLNKQDERLAKQTQSLNELGAKLKTLLVLPATSQPQVLRAAYHHYKTDNVTACIWTKLDEAASLGELISLAIDKAIPVAYSTDGQNIPDDIAVTGSLMVVRQAVELAKNHTVDDVDMSDELQSLIG